MNTIKVIGLKTLGFFNLIIKNYWLLLSKKLKRYDTGRVLTNAIYYFGNFVINIEGVKLSRAKQFLTTYVTRV